MSGERLLKAREVANLLGLEMATVLDHWQSGDLPGFRLYGRKGGPVRFRGSEIDRWLEDRCRAGYIPPDNRSGPAATHRPGPGTGGTSSDAARILRPVDRD